LLLQVSCTQKFKVIFKSSYQNFFREFENCIFFSKITKKIQISKKFKRAAIFFNFKKLRKLKKKLA